MNSHPRLRPINETDASFVYDTFLSGRPELSGLPRELVQLQLHAQGLQYAEHYPSAIEYLVVDGDEKIGRCIISRGSREYRLLDLCLTSAHRGRGVGSGIVCDLVAEAATARVAVRLSVWSTNGGAVRLYRRLGFEPCGEQHGYVTMEFLPDRSAIA